MMFDEQARKALHSQLRAEGYRGSSKALFDELRAQSYGTEVRLFVSSALSVTLANYPAAYELMSRLCRQAQSRFDYAWTSTTDLGRETSIVFSHTKRHKRKRGSPLRLEGVTVSAEIREGRATVRVQAYIGNERSRNIFRYFELQQKQECDK